MISFIKFLKVVLPIISVTTATLTTVSLISHKKHDPDLQEKSKAINLDKFVTLSEDFEEKLMLYAKDGKGENVSFEDAEKAKKLLEHLKENGSLEKFPEFETPEQLAEFLDKLPKGIFNDLLKDSKLSPDELINLDPNTLNNLGRFGENIRSQQQQINNDMNGQTYSQEDAPKIDVSGSFDVPKINGLDSEQTKENLKAIEETTKKALDASKALQDSKFVEGLESLGSNSTLSDVAEQVADSLSSEVSSISTPKMQPSQIPDISVTLEQSEERGEVDSDAAKDSGPTTEGDRGMELDNEIKDGTTEDSDEGTSSRQDLTIDSNDLQLDSGNSQMPEHQTPSESTPPPSAAVEPRAEEEGQQLADDRSSPEPSVSQNEITPTQPNSPRDKIDLTVPPLPDLNLPDVPFDFSALNNVFDALSSLGEEAAGGLSLAELKDWAGKLAKTSNSLGNLISKSQS